MSKQLIAYAKIESGKNTEWEEDFVVDSKESAETQIEETVKYFNETLKPGESKRYFKGIVRFEEKEERPVPDYSLDADIFIDDEENDFFDDIDFDDRY